MRVSAAFGGLAFLLIAAPIQAAEYWVGLTAEATHRTIRSAILDAQFHPDLNHTIHVAGGVWHEHLLIEDLRANGTLTLRGGWNPLFGRDHPDAGPVTVLDGDGDGPVVEVHLSNSYVFMEDFTIQNGGAVHDASGHGGAGLRVLLSHAAQFSLRRAIVRQNRLVAATQAFGGGLDANLGGSSEMYLSAVNFFDNATSTLEAGFADSAGAHIYMRDNALLSMQDCLFAGNRATGHEYAAASALFITVSDNAEMRLRRATVVGNQTSAPDGQAFGTIFLDLQNATLARPQIVAEQLFVQGNSISPGNSQVVLFAGSGSMRFTDSVVAQQSGRGIQAFPLRDNIALTNLTVVDNVDGALDVASDIEDYHLVVSNSILLGEVRGTMGSDHVSTEDPGFVDRADNDYRLAPGSPAIDAGNNTPLGGLGSEALGPTARIIGPTVDRGAHETTLAATTASAAVICRSTADEGWRNACRCARDPSGEETRCAFLSPDLSIESLSALDWRGLKADPIVTWRLQASRTPLKVLDVTSEALVGKKWIEKKRLSKSSAGTQLDLQSTAEHSFSVHVPKGDVALRLTVKYREANSPAVKTAQVHLTLPVQSGQ